MTLQCSQCGSAIEEGARFCPLCGRPAALSAHGGDPWIGREVLGRYRVRSLIGEGGMGRVYLAEQRIGGVTRPVAIKTLIPGAGDATMATRFLRECETVATLQSPNTVQVYDFGVVDGALVLVMEFIDGHSLARELQRGPMPLSTVDAVVLQVGGSLKEAHQRGVVHRDLKPENILLTRRGGYDHFVKLVDFGIARTAGGSKTPGEKLTQSGVILGTPPYMAPEQFAAEGVVDHRADLYALGVIVYEMLAGRPPFEARSPWEYGALHTAHAPPPLEGFPSAAILPAHRRAAVHRCLEKRPEDRPASVDLFLAEFLGVDDPWSMLPGGGRASSPSLTPRGSREPALSPTVLAPVRPTEAPRSDPAAPPRPRWPFVLTAVAALAVVAGGFFVMGASTRRGRRRVSRAPDAGATAPRPPREDLRRWMAYLQAHHSVEASKAALGARDRAYARVSPGGSITLECADGWRATTDGGQGRDLEVFVDPATTGAYRVEVGDDPARLRVVGDGVSGSASFDVDAVGARGFRYVKITPRGRAAVGVDAVFAPSGAAAGDASAALVGELARRRGA